MSTHEYFTKDQNRLLNIAGWANNLAWLALILYFLYAALTVFEDQYNYQRLYQLSSTQGTYGYWDMVRSNPIYYFLNIGSVILRKILLGFINFVVLRGVGLGLYMIVETDMNYRKKENEGGEK